MGAAHVPAEGLAMGEDLATGLADKLSVALLLDDLRLGDLSLLVSLLDIAPYLATVDDVLARGGIRLFQRSVRWWLCLLTLP